MIDTMALLGVLMLATMLIGFTMLLTVWNARRKVRCPADGKTAELEVDAQQALRHVFANEPEKVVECSHWPAKAGCDQRCVRKS
jgi:hypothetical protein